MDTHLMSDANTGRVSVQIHENLVKRDLEGNFQPVLATEVVSQRGCHRMDL